MSDKPRGSSHAAHVRTPIAAQDRATASRDNVIRLWTACPMGDAVTDYDRRNLPVFNFLLNAASEGVSLHDMARIAFRLDAAKHPDRVEAIVRTHLARARWLQGNVFPFLDW